jgi:tetratricopeptide (TPR) repeat protein
VQESSKSIEALSEEAARLCLEQASALTSETESELYLGMATSVRITKAFHRSLSSQLIADALIRAGQTKDAEQFLESAVEETPEDFEAVFALGAFRLRTALFPGEDEQTSSDKAAQIQLLKAAKMNSNKAPPFALLGFWYEEKADFNRAVGCYSKALLLYPSDQVAGRGILRLRSYSEVKDFCEAASNSSSPFNGWAWHALGMNNAMIEFDDSQAIVCFQEALRCIDVTAPQNDPLSLFYNPVSRSQHNQATELSLCWADLAGCYRRLGKYSAAIKAYESANEAANGDLHPEVLASWAQVEMELGLAEEAAEKFERCLKRNDVAITPIASYGMGISLLSMAQRDLRDGKAAAALATLTKAVTVVRSISISEPPNGSFHCSTKLLGDLYSFGASLPPAVFDDSVSLSSQGGLHHLRRQLEFVSQGEACYRSAEEMEASHEENADSVRASTACDLGTNVLLQGHILSILHGEGQGIEPNMSASETLSNLEVRKCFDRAAEEFKRSIRLDPTFAPAWCGMGCAVSGLDPLLAQHAFVRAIQLDKSLPDAWANLSFLYASRHSPRAASCVLDELTQVADTPMMWICRAALLERESVGCAEVDGKKEKLSQAADAYEAALQVMKEPSALLGLGMTCRVTGREEAKQQSLSFLTEFSGTAGLCIGADLLRSAILIEDGIRKVKLGPTAWKREVIDSALDAIDDLTNSAYQNFHSQVSASDIQEESKEGYVDMQQISALRSKFGSQVSPAAETQETTDSRRIQLDILHDPNNASMWLSLAKLIAKDMQKTKGDKRKRLVLQTIESANLACDKAVVILTNQVVRPRRDVDLMVTPAQEVAEALALSFMVRKAGLELRGSLKDPPELPRPQSYDLQRSIMIWPRCATARATFAEAEQTS